MVDDITLILIDQKLAADLNDGRDTFESRHSVRVMTDIIVVREVIKQTLDMLAREPRDARWGGYLVADPETNTIVGTCGFKEGPTHDGVVEIAYFTFPEFEGQGYATAMAKKLKGLAENSPEVKQIIAHTLPMRNQSTRILEKIGMHLIGEIEDLEDGKVWRWMCTVST